VRLRRVCAVLAAGTVVTFSVIALLLHGTSEGVRFGSTDRIAMVGLGLVVAAGILALGRPRVEADERCIRVRNVIGSHTVPWELVRAVTFPDGSPWVSLELVNGDTLAVMAVQAADRERAVATVQALRALHERSRRH
jgi:hypothetical protein